MILRALFIEDSENDAALILRHLNKNGYQVEGEVVQTAPEMKKSLAGQKWDIIIADYQLPEFDAPAALALLQETGLDIPFIVVSGAIGEEIAVNLMRSGARDYLIKGKLARLGPAVERELSEARMRRQRKADNEALVESERNLQKSQSLAHIGHWLKDCVTGVVTWSDEMYKIFAIQPASAGASLEELWLKSISSEHTTRQTFVDLQPGEQIEYSILRPDGSIRFLLSTAGEVLSDKDGNVIQRSGVVQDITERKAIELELLEKISESTRRAMELEIISSISSNLRQVHSRREMIDVVLNELVALLNASFATLALLNHDTLVFDHAIGSRQPWEPHHLTNTIKCFQEIALTRKPLISIHSQNEQNRSNLPGWLRENMNPAGMTIFSPLISGESMIGAIMLSFEQTVSISMEQMNLLIAISDIVGNAINRQLASERLEAMVERREQDLEYIYKITSAASSSYAIREALQEALTLTLAAVRAEMGGIYLLDEDSLAADEVIFSDPQLKRLESFSGTFTPEVIQTIIQKKRTLLLSESELNGSVLPLASIPSKNAAGFPMLFQGKVNGVLAIHKAGGEQVNLEELTLLSFIADHLALVVENTRLIKKSEQAAILDERSRLARALHDSVTQQLYSAKLYTVGAQRYLAQNNIKEVEAYLCQIGELTQQALRELRMMVYQLRSLELADNGLLGALQNRLASVEKRSGIQVSFLTEGLLPLPENMEENLFRVVMEALNNSLKYARASNLDILISQTDECVKIRIQDDGIGFDPSVAMEQGGMGLATMRERTEKMSGVFRVDSHPGGGTRIEIEVPFMINSKSERGSLN